MGHRRGLSNKPMKLPVALDARVRAVMDAMRRVDWQLGRILRLFLDCRLYATLGFSSGARYVRERLGISTRKARMLVALERKTWACPALLDAYRRGAISCLRALTIAPVASERRGATCTITTSASAPRAATTPATTA